MSRPIQDILQEAKVFIDQNPGLFNGVEPGNVIAHLGTVNPNLWNQLSEAYKTQGGQSFSNTAKGALMGSVLPGIGTAIGAGTGAVMDFTAAGAPTLNEWALANPAFGQALIGQAPPPVALQKPQPVQSTDNIVQQEVAKRTNANLQQQLDDIFGGVTQSTTNQINDQYAQQRGKQVAEEAAMGRLTSPNSIIPLSQTDRSQGLALSDAIGKIQAQKASGQLDVSKAIENILANRDINNQDTQYKRDALLAGINNSAEDRGASLAADDAKLRTQRDLAGDEQNDPLNRLNKVTNSVSDLATAAGGSKGLKDIFR